MFIDALINIDGVRFIFLCREVVVNMYLQGSSFINVSPMTN